MEKYQTIKANSEQVFQQMLYAYSLQLEQKDRVLNLLNVEEYTPIAMVNVCSTRINYMKRNGNRALAVCSKTIVNHRHRFEEAGILIDYQNLGSGKFGGGCVPYKPRYFGHFRGKNGAFCRC